MLHIDNLHIQVGGFALHNVSFSVKDGDYFVLLGASGVGKTMLLEALAGLIPLKTGRILWNGEDLALVPLQKRAMGLVYQDQALFPHLTVGQNILYGARTSGMGRRERNHIARSFAEDVGVHLLLNRYPDTLSGGEAQRTALARALATQPRCLLLDEPLSALDTHARSAMRGLLRKLNRRGQTVIHVTHDYEEALSLAEHVGILEGDTVVQVGTPTEVFHHPRSEFVARFVGIRNAFPGLLEACPDADGDAAPFVSNGIRFHILTQAQPGPGLMLVRSEDVTLSHHRPDSSAQNCFAGRITDIARARPGIEVYVDIGVEVAALITTASADRLGLEPGKDLWVSFKAGAARFLED